MSEKPTIHIVNWIEIVISNGEKLGLRLSCLNTDVRVIYSILHICIDPYSSKQGIVFPPEQLIIRAEPFCKYLAGEVDTYTQTFVGSFRKAGRQIGIAIPGPHTEGQALTDTPHTFLHAKLRTAVPRAAASVQLFSSRGLSLNRVGLQFIQLLPCTSFHDALARLTKWSMMS